MHQLEQFRAGLLLGGVNILVAVDDIQVDGQPFAVRRQGPVAFGDMLE